MFKSCHVMVNVSTRDEYIFEYIVDHLPIKIGQLI